MERRMGRIRLPRRVFVRLSAAAGALVAAGSPFGARRSIAAQDELSGELVISSWGGVFTDSTRTYFAEPFSGETGVEVAFVDAPNQHVAQVQAQHEANRVVWDVVDSLDASAAYTLWDMDLLEPLPDDLKQTLRDVSIEGAVTDFGILQSSISTLIACNPAEAERCPTTPAEFWDVEQFPGPRSLQNDPLEGLMWALQADGVPPDQLFPLDIDRAFAKLAEIAPNVQVWWDSGDQSQQVFRDAEVLYGSIWNGRAFTLREQGFELEVSWEGAHYTPAYTVVVKEAPNKDAAFAYLEWYATHPEAQAEWVKALTYGVSNRGVTEYLPENVLSLLPEAPNNFATSVPIDAQWWLENREAVEPRWQDFLAGG